MEVTLLRRLSLLVLAAVLAAAGITFAPKVSKNSSRAPGAQSGQLAVQRKPDARWREVSQTDKPIGKERGEAVYQGFCSACHGASRAGVPSVFPSLIDVSKRQSDAEIASQIRHGKGRMLAFPDMSDDDMKALLLFLKTPPPADSSKLLKVDRAHAKIAL